MTRITTAARLAALAALPLLAACGGDDAAEAEIAEAQAELDAERAAAAQAEPPAVDPAAAAQAEAEARAQAFLAQNAEKDGVRVTDSGLQIETIEEGDGPSPTDDQVIRIDYAATFADGRPFDSNEQNGAPAVLPSYQALQLPGLIEALPQMKEGGRARLTLPPALAFGDGGVQGYVAPGEVMVFDITLVEVVDMEDTERLAALQAEEQARQQARQAEAQARMAQLAEQNAQASEAFLAEATAGDGVQVTESGLAYEVIEDGGDGASPKPTDTVRVHYRGTLPTGQEFDSSYSRGTPAEFQLNQVIGGWTEGLQLMNVGDTYKFYIPSDLAYGPSGTPGGPIGPNQALVFEVELLGVAEEVEAEGADAQ